MNKYILALTLLTVSLSSCEQTYKKYDFPDIGLHISIPNGYLVQDTFSKPSYSDANGNQITDSAIIEELKNDLWKGLLTVSSSDYENTISFNIAVETAKTGNLDQYYNFSKNMQQLMSKQKMIDYDTSSFIVNVGNVKIYKFLTSSKKSSPNYYSGIYIAKVKKYFLIIKTDYTDKAFGEIFEKAIFTSKFD